VLSLEDVRIPRSFEIMGGGDTGTFLGGVIAAVSPDYHLYVLELIKNYHYTVDGTIEEDGGIGPSVWLETFRDRMRYWSGKQRNGIWVDANTTFKREVIRGLSFRMNHVDLELRTEITREYVRNGRIHFMPGTELALYELEEAKFPEEETLGGRYKRIKRKDHCLDGIEHICSRRPHPKMANSAMSSDRKKLIHKLIDQHKDVMGGAHEEIDPFLGRN
jgi:hypothetical protein